MTTDTRTPAEMKYDLERSGELYIAPMTDAPARTMEDIYRAQIDAWNKMDQDERLFTTIVTRWYDNLAPTHQAMGQAGMILLSAAVDGVGPEDTDADEQEQIAARIHHAAFTDGHQEGYDKGLKDGMEGCLAYLEQKMTERKAAKQ